MIRVEPSGSQSFLLMLESYASLLHHLDFEASDSETVFWLGFLLQ